MRLRGDQGLAYEALFETHPEFTVTEFGTAALEAVPERGESLFDCCKHVLAAFDRLVVDAGDETVLVVTHSGPLYALLSHLKGIDYVTAVAGPSQQNYAVNELWGDPDDGFAIVRENDTSYRD